MGKYTHKKHLEESAFLGAERTLGVVVFNADFLRWDKSTQLVYITFIGQNVKLIKLHSEDGSGKASSSKNELWLEKEESKIWWNK